MAWWEITEQRGSRDTSRVLLSVLVGLEAWPSPYTWPMIVEAAVFQEPGLYEQGAHESEGCCLKPWAGHQLEGWSHLSSGTRRGFPEARAEQNWADLSATLWKLFSSKLNYTQKVSAFSGCLTVGKMLSDVISYLSRQLEIHRCQSHLFLPIARHF